MASPLALVTLLLAADSAEAVVGAAIFGSALLLLHAASAGYHVLGWRSFRRIDHMMIYAFIPAVYTPFALTTLGLGWGIPILSVTWTLAGVGMVLTAVWESPPRWQRTALYLALGWVAVVPSYELWRSLPSEAFGLLLLGGLSYSIGGLVYVARRPSPLPRVFGHHEVFHALTAAATGMFYFVVLRYVMPA